MRKDVVTEQEQATDTARTERVTVDEVGEQDRGRTGRWRYDRAGPVERRIRMHAHR